jgi:opacity protein-like surface antigen
MKQFLLLMVVFCFLYSSAIAQSKIEFGVNTEGSLLIFGHIPHYSQPQKNTLGAGIGVYASRNIAGKLSADLGVMYRFKQLKEFYDIGSTGYGYGYGGYDGSSPYSPETVQGWKNFPLHYVVVPVHLQYIVYKDLFVRGGIEASWLTNYDPGKDKTEWNWTLGFGSQYHKLKWSVNYIRGFKDVGFANDLFTIDGMRSATVYRNNMLQLSLSYPLWQKK